MKSSTLRVFLKVHTWVGLVAGLALFIAFYAGAITVFTDQLHQWERNDARGVAAQSTALAQPLIDAVLRAHPAAADDFILRLPSADEPRLLLEWYEERKPQAGQLRQFSLAPDGALVEHAAKSELAELVYRLHYTAGLPKAWGIYAIGFVCVLYGMALLSGVIVYAPTLLKSLFALRPGKNLKVFWQDAHNAIGMLSLPFHVIFAWSGAVMTIGTLMLAPFQFLVFDGKLLKIIEPELSLVSHPVETGKRAPLMPAHELLARAQAAAPGLQAKSMNYDHVGDSSVQVQVYGSNAERTLNNLAGVALNGSNGAVLRVVQPHSMSPGNAFLRALYVLHYGNFGHAAMQWLYFVLGLAGAFLFYSGNLLWVEARRKRNQLEQPRNTRLMAQLTLGVCLGCIAGISAMFIANKLVPQGWGALALWEQRSYYAAFFLCVAWAFARPPARAGHELLLLCALLTGGIPLANYWSSGDHLLGTLWRGQWLVFGVDAVALLAAWLYWRMARATLRRGLNGDSNSVWALPGARDALPAARHATGGKLRADL
ncbi:PepSY-associated TM helix domain-containing protein [Janthinobacterium fluminis]|uniref:PepSY-associated TM helix domain-containing protein n=1 Tax=Janthinobacterium fluminis TaxID=2987524 RepID=A0ABT5K0L4_9BURK|nr:PepSY-associated TM helix domain-containing protein [Janthinobacterium fluminis]MDC8758464.1 PepSY-associated TM helix domain-containing protein [Janthinobacterium fluminis]